MIAMGLRGIFTFSFPSVILPSAHRPARGIRPHPVHNHLSRHPQSQSQLLRSPHPSISPMPHLQGVPMTPAGRDEQKSSLCPSLHTATLVPLGRQPPLQDMDKGKMRPWLSQIPRLPGQMASGLKGAGRTPSEEGIYKMQSLPKLGLGVKCSH